MNKNEKNKRLHLVLSALCIAGFGCAAKNPALIQAHNNYDTIAKDPAIVRDAPVAVHDAKQTLDAADAAARKGKDDGEVTHLAQLTDKKIEIAKANAARKSYENEIGKTDKNRSEVVLASRTREADAANRKAALATTQAKEAQDLAKSAQAKSAATESELKTAAAREAALKLELEGLKAKETEAGMQLTLRDMMFEVGKTELTSGGARDVVRIANIAKQHPERAIVVEGYTDSTGSDSLNQDLSERRARSIENLLKESGIPAEKITAKGYGKSFPVASNKTGAGRQMNRRVVVTLLNEGKQASDIEPKNNM